MFEIKPIRTDQDYEAALAEIERLFDAKPGAPEADRLEVLTILVEDYEEKNFAIPLPDPIEAIEYHMERLRLSRADLEPYIGSRARVSEVLNRNRGLTMLMIRALHMGLDIPLEILAQDYALVTDSEKPFIQSVSDVLTNVAGELTTQLKGIIPDVSYNAGGTATFPPVRVGEFAPSPSKVSLSSREAVSECLGAYAPPDQSGLEYRTIECETDETRVATSFSYSEG